jgi:hypothetical protein
MSEIMLWLSGVDRNVLSHCEGERNKFVAMGGTVLTTAVLATLAATFTSHQFVHTPLFFALVLGIGWGFAIMNLDRWLLISIRRQETPRKTILMALPRVFLAILVGAVIAHPLVLRVFEKEVSAQAERDSGSALSDGRKEIREHFAAIPALRREAGELHSEVTQIGSGAGLAEDPEYQRALKELHHLEPRAEKAQQAALCEYDGTCGTDHSGAGLVYEAKKNASESLATQVDAQRSEVAAIRARLQERESKQAGSTRQFAQRGQAQAESKLEQLVDDRKEALVVLKDEFGPGRVGLLDRVEALNNLTAQHPAMLTIEVLLFLFILAIDSMPAIAKVLMSLGKPSLYEVTQSDLEEAATIALQQQTKAHARASEIEAELVVDEAATRRSFMKEVQDDLVKQSVEAMREAGEKFVGLWREAILSRVPRMVRKELDRNDMGEEDSAPSGPPTPGGGSNGGGAARNPRG